MAIGSVSRVVSTSNPLQGADGFGAAYREIIAAIRELNSSEMLGRRRELRPRRQSGKVSVELIDLETGEILGDLPPGEVLQMAAQLHRERGKGDR